MVKKTISLKQKHVDWLTNNHISLSHFVQAKIDEVMKINAY